MPSPLDFGSTEAFRKKLFTRNLKPYSLAPYVDPNQVAYPTVLTDSSVVNAQPDPFEYGIAVFNDRASRFNVYSPDTPFQYNTQTVIKESQFEPYPNFDASFYEPVDILYKPDPLGSNGLLSSDSFIAKLGAVQLKKAFEDRIATEIYQRTQARINAFGANSGSNLFGVLTNRIPLIEPNYQITVPGNPVIAAVDLATRLSGSYFPVSPIPGSYWDTEIRLGQPTTIQQIKNAFNFVTESGVGKFFARLLGADSGSQKFLSNTGSGQRSVLFKNIDYNKFKPDYDRNFVDRLGGAIVGASANSSDFYVGSKSSDPGMIFSPVGDIPTDEFGRSVQSPVYGPSELAQLYEGVEQSPGFGANGVPYVDGGGIEGGFTWVSPKYKLNAGRYVGPGGKEMGEDPDFAPSTYNDAQSTNYKFRTGSILDDTQRLVDSQPAGKKRFEHVGNAIDQVSKIFSDGYTEMTKGSRVISYVGPIGNEVGAEYCRVFTKDTPYLQFNDLQKTDGMTTEGRKFSYSVMDKTYNLNIAPNRRNGGQDSTNLIGTGNNAYAKKYMFSIENLAWRTSKMFEDLADCEKGPNGGRVMWFPPYGLSVSESVSAGWNTSEFLGRPEPIYTYKSTSRSGTLTWKIIVDHPSVLNLIVNKVLKDQTRKNEIDGIINSFFAGCRKYDLYELAKKYATIERSDLYEIQRMLTNPAVTKEEIIEANNQINVGIPSVGGNTTNQQNNDKTPEPFNWTQYYNYGYYFENDVPKGSDVNYGGLYDIYTSSSNQEKYAKEATAPNLKPDPQAKTQVANMFSSGVIGNFNVLKKGGEFYNNLLKFLTDGYSFTISLVGAASAPQTVNYNKSLGERRTSAVATYYNNDDQLKKYVSTGKLIFKQESEGENAVGVQVKGLDTNSIKCTDGTDVGKKDIYTRNAMACRRVTIKNIAVTPPTTQPPQQNTSSETSIAPSTPPGSVPTPVQGGSQTNITGPVETITQVQRDNITKRVLRKLLSECDYFDMIKEETPMVFDNLKDKLQFFDPAFHSMTPEGLNSRLTFLQQCMRPGESIPTIKTVNGQSVAQYDVAVNTAFGAPPILILRVGDFFNTKIAPNSLSITYENLDINPEGIGVQPMIANISLGFNMLGGAGLKEPVDKLQNALTFNYYANTEMYDERADATDIESAQALDADFIKNFQNNETLNNLGDVNNGSPYAGKGNNETIGVVTNKTIGDDNLDTGDINYKDIMNSLIDESQTYFNNIINKSKTIVDQYNGVMMQQWGYERYYMSGKIEATGSDDENLYGKPQNIEKRINEYFSDYTGKIQSGDNSFIDYLESPEFNFSNKIIRAVKNNYKAYITNKQSTFYNPITVSVQEVVNQEQNFIQLLTRLNVMYLTSNPDVVDGYALANGNIKVYQCTATADVDPSSTPTPPNTFIEMQQDITTVANNLKEYKTLIQQEITFPSTAGNLTGSLVTNGTGNQAISIYQPFTTAEDPSGGDFWEAFGQTNKIAYLIMSNVISNDKTYQDFKNAIINDIVKNRELSGDGNTELSSVFDKYWLNVAKPIFQKETTAAKTFIEKFEKDTAKNFVKYTPYKKDKPRKFTFKQQLNPSTGEKDAIKQLGMKVNLDNSKTTWNNKIKLN
jgi:hypothetical protein